ncbi:hypothetical protein GRJ2_002304000 [Grus japonensis]|uniref:Uncharacterized protein n=1 Tax=Grus japonensis TaxID=30415 RepID=A0ABC9XL27_GRUJA
MQPISTPRRKPLSIHHIPALMKTSISPQDYDQERTTPRPGDKTSGYVKLRPHNIVAAGGIRKGLTKTSWFPLQNVPEEEVPLSSLAGSQEYTGTKRRSGSVFTGSSQPEGAEASADPPGNGSGRSTAIKAAFSPEGLDGALGNVV